MKLHWSVKRGGIIVKTYKEHLLTERNRQVNSGVTPSVRKQDNKNRRVNRTVKITLVWKPATQVGLSAPPSQYHAHPLDASHRSEELEDGEQNGSVDNSDHREDDMAVQEQFCDAVETMAVPEDVQQFGDDQSDGVKYYLSTLAPEHVSTVVSSAARPVVKKIVMDQRDGNNSFYAMTDGAIFEYDRDKCSVTDWFPLGMKGKKRKKKKDSYLRQRRKVARSWSSEVPTTHRQHETSY